MLKLAIPLLALQTLSACIFYTETYREVPYYEEDDVDSYEEQDRPMADDGMDRPDAAPEVSVVIDPNGIEAGDTHILSLTFEGSREVTPDAVRDLVFFGPDELVIDTWQTRSDEIILVITVPEDALTGVYDVLISTGDARLFAEGVLEVYGWGDAPADGQDVPSTGSGGTSDGGTGGGSDSGLEPCP